MKLYNVALRSHEGISLWYFTIHLHWYPVFQPSSSVSKNFPPTYDSLLSLSSYERALNPRHTSSFRGMASRRLPFSPFSSSWLILVTLHVPFHASRETERECGVFAGKISRRRDINSFQVLEGIPRSWFRRIRWRVNDDAFRGASLWYRTRVSRIFHERDGSFAAPLGNVVECKIEVFPFPPLF